MATMARILGDRLLDKLVPRLKASACCGPYGMHYCCTYCDSPYATCIFMCECTIIHSCTPCP